MLGCHPLAWNEREIGQGMIDGQAQLFGLMHIVVRTLGSTIDPQYRVATA
jgi:hypothetical protein